jgi:hypothetical protein
MSDDGFMKLVTQCPPGYERLLVEEIEFGSPPHVAVLPFEVEGYATYFLQAALKKAPVPADALDDQDYVYSVDVSPVRGGGSLVRILVWYATQAARTQPRTATETERRERPARRTPRPDRHRSPGR